MEIELNYHEISLGEQIGKRRNEFAEQSPNIRNVTTVDTSRKSEQLNIQGAQAEIAAAKAMNLYPDLELHPGPVFPEYDLITHNGLKIDVKDTSHPDGNLIVPWRKQWDKKPDYYLLVIGKCPTFFMHGFYPASMMFRKENEKDVGWGACWFVERQRLIKFERFLYLAEQGAA